MRKLFNTEYYKLLHSGGFWIIGLTALLFSLLNLFLTYIDNGQSLLEIGAIEGVFHQSFTEGRLPIMILSGCLSGIIIGNDFFVRFFQSAINSGHSRFSIIFS